LVGPVEHVLKDLLHDPRLRRVILIRPVAQDDDERDRFLFVDSLSREVVSSVQTDEPCQNRRSDKGEELSGKKEP
jgi:hypothetical protein